MVVTTAGRVFPTFLASGGAKCATEDPELFVRTDDKGRTYARRVKAAKAVCAHCPLRRPCLAFAITTRQVGVWGGTTDQERYRAAA